MKTKNLTNLAQTLVITSTLILGMATPAHAGLFSSRKEKVESVDQNPGQTLNIVNRSESAEQALAAEAMLQDMSARMTEKLVSIEDLIKSDKTGEALVAAKTLLDNVRIKTGIDPKARLRENFLVATVFPESATGMSSLNDEQKDIVIRAVRDYRGGLYLDVMNLSKRTSLLYIKALHAEMKRSGGVTQEDRNKIIQDLTAASVIPMPVVDKKGKKIIVLDEDVANADHIYLFNREIKMYLLESKDLKIDEAGFDTFKQQYKSSLGSVSSSGTDTVEKCLAIAAQMGTYDDIYSVQRKCTVKFFNSFPDIKTCLDYAKKLGTYDDQYAVQRKCVAKFN